MAIRYLTAAEAARELRVSRKTVAAMCARGEIPSRKAGRVVARLTAWDSWSWLERRARKLAAMQVTP
jgi:excisionase family DNA binding protein